MREDPNRPIDYSCPYCEGRSIETVATAPYVRGFLVAYQIGSKDFIGCTSCVRTRVLGEAGLSLLLGWFSITALIINPFLIVYNVLQAPFIRINYAKARKKLAEAGIPEDQSQIDLAQLCYFLAANMIVADGVVEEEEIQVAVASGTNLFPEFDETALRAVLNDRSKLPHAPDIATLLREILSPEAKQALFSYLCEIAQADGHVDDSEKQLLGEIAQNLDVDLSAA